MNYNLAKKLWDAKYPFKRRDDAIQVMCLCTEEVCETIFGREFRFDGVLYPEPTLSDLIKNLGVEFGDLTYYPEGFASDPREWSANGRGATAKEALGATPEEAVANLYLALKK